MHIVFSIEQQDEFGELSASISTCSAVYLNSVSEGQRQALTRNSSVQAANDGRARLNANPASSASASFSLFQIGEEVEKVDGDGDDDVRDRGSGKESDSDRGSGRVSGSDSGRVGDGGGGGNCDIGSTPVGLVGSDDQLLEAQVQIQIPHRQQSKSQSKRQTSARNSNSPPYKVIRIPAIASPGIQKQNAGGGLTSGSKPDGGFNLVSPVSSFCPEGNSGASFSYPDLDLQATRMNFDPLLPTHANATKDGTNLVLLSSHLLRHFFSPHSLVNYPPPPPPPPYPNCIPLLLTTSLLLSLPLLPPPSTCADLLLVIFRSFAPILFAPFALLERADMQNITAVVKNFVHKLGMSFSAKNVETSANDGTLSTKQTVVRPGVLAIGGSVTQGSKIGDSNTEIGPVTKQRSTPFKIIPFKVYLHYEAIIITQIE